MQTMIIVILTQIKNEKIDFLIVIYSLYKKIK